MPIPFLFIGIAAGTAALGIGKSAKAVHDKHDANETNEYAQSIADKAKDRAELARKNCGRAIQNLGKTKVSVLDTEMARFIDSFGKLHNVELDESYGMVELKKFKLDKQSFAELKSLQSMATSIAAGIGTGTVAGALTAFGAYSAVHMLGIASTGAAIGSLTGAAATNATLAFLGGGALAAEGLGIAGGTAVLGGLVAGPALAVMGFVVGAKAKEARDKAYANLAKAKEIREEMNTAVLVTDGIRRRANMLERLLLKLDAIFEPFVYSMEEIIASSGTDFSNFTYEQKKTIAAAMSMAGAIKAVLDTPLLTEEGKLTKESELIISATQPALEANG